jgi:hypothetical protein
MTTKPLPRRITSICPDENNCQSSFPDGWGHQTRFVHFTVYPKWEFEELSGSSSDDPHCGATFLVIRPNGVVSTWLADQPVGLGLMTSGSHSRSVVSDNLESFLTAIRLTFG